MLMLFTGGPAGAIELKKGDVAPEFKLPSTAGMRVDMYICMHVSVCVLFSHALFSPRPFGFLIFTGKDISLSDFKGKNIVLYFYNKDFSSGCSLEAKRFQVITN